MHKNHTGQVAVIAGAGPAGLTAALELLRRSNITPLVFEPDMQVGGISKTINYRGNRMDLGGHRFFSKSDWVMNWWQKILPVAEDQVEPGIRTRLHYQNHSRTLPDSACASASSDAVMLVRQRLSRIFYRRRYFDYPLTLSVGSLRNLGVPEVVRIAASYGRTRMSRRGPEVSLEDFFINRFGDRLYRTFFKDYTEKVWGVRCDEISAEWGAQRIKGLSVKRALGHALKRPFRSLGDTSQKRTETSLIERFLYPKFGPGQMWEEVADQVTLRGGQIHLGHRVVGLERNALEITGVRVRNETSGVEHLFSCDHFVSTMPVKDLTLLLRPEELQIARVAGNLPYRDFMTAGLLVRRMRRDPRQSSPVSANGMPPDNWIYIQEPDVKIGRLQIFNNWSPHMVANADTIWLGLEYFCREGDDLWSMDDGKFIDFAAQELEKIGMIDRRDVIDGTLVRVPKAYPAYFGDYRHFEIVRTFLDRFTNLYPVGRNGMHRYNNQDHSMLAANSAVDSIIAGGRGKADIWEVNADEEYHEEKGKAVRG